MVVTRRSQRLSDKVPSSSATTVNSDEDSDDFQPLPNVNNKKRLTRSQASDNKRRKTTHEAKLKKLKEEEQDSEDLSISVPSLSYTLSDTENEQGSPASSSSAGSVPKKEKVKNDKKKVKLENVKGKEPSEDNDDSEEDAKEETEEVVPDLDEVGDEVADNDRSPAFLPSDEEAAAAVASSESEDEDSDDEPEVNTYQYYRRGRWGRRFYRRRRFVVRRPRMLGYERTRNKVNEQHKELETVWTDLEKVEKKDCKPIEQPSFLSLPLLPFQKQGVAWMIQQEKNKDFRGGILADEMGMGKTIQTISLLLSDGKGPNLVVAPTVALGQWKREIETHTNTGVKVLIYHGSSRTRQKSELMKFDIILTTYSIMESTFRRQEYGFKRANELVKEKSLLHQIKWHRIILDEAHNIKDRSCNTARSVFNLKADYRWSLTGTPLQNRVGELYSLIRFMQADPYAYYYCTTCSCKSINWKFTDRKSCDDCGHTPMSHVCWWNNEVLKPIQVHGYVGAGKEALTKLCLLLDRIMLRRTKIQCADDLGLPPRNVTVRRDIFAPEEEDVYRSLYSNVARQFTSYVEEGTVLNNYANIFELLTKMRQCADHPDLVTKKATDNQQLVCMLCHEPPEDPISASCKHVFCRECCTQYYNSFDDTLGQKAKCPSCFAEFSVDLYQPTLEIEQSAGGNSNYSKSSIINRINMSKWRSSTKIEALFEELSKLRREDKTIKSIVFSQFVNFLDLVNWRLSRAGFECVRLNGTMSPAQRDEAINYFMTKPDATVFLISLKAGGVALNLTEASRVFICDPWWNPAAELQAMDRIHRLGQHRPIRITRLIIENSIESRIIELQEKKSALVESTVGNNAQALDKLTVEDLRFLFVM